MKESNSSAWKDIIKALSILEPTDKETICAILRMLGESKKDLCEIPSQEKYIEKKNKEEIKNELPGDEKSSQSKKDKVYPSKTSIPSKLIPTGRAQLKFPDWLKSPLTLNRENPLDYFAPFNIEPLFIPNWTRAILSGTLSSYAAIGKIEIDQIINKILKAEPLVNVPKRLCPTMVNGVQILIDKSEAMEPFYRDQTYLESVIRKVAGQYRTHSLLFMGCPLWGVRDLLNWNTSDYHPPPKGTTILLLTDLGINRSPRITRQAGINDWLMFAEMVNKAGCSLVAFVPYPMSKRQKPLCRQIKIIQWDRKTSVVTIRRVLNKGSLRKDAR